MDYYCNCCRSIGSRARTVSAARTGSSSRIDNRGLTVTTSIKYYRLSPQAWNSRVQRGDCRHTRAWNTTLQKKRLSPRASNTTVQKGDCRHTRARLSLSANVSSMLTTLALTAGTLASGAALSARAALAAGAPLTARAALATGTLGSGLSLLRFLLSLLSPARRAAARRSVLQTAAPAAAAASKPTSERAGAAATLAVLLAAPLQVCLGASGH